MNRRKFLAASLAATTGGILVAADLLSTKTFFLPPAGGWIKPEIRYGLPYPGRVIGADFSLGHDITVVSVTVRPGFAHIGDLIFLNNHTYRVWGATFKGYATELDLVRA
jgi:hypothetical protein